jgi:hypothetical protein
MRTSAVANVIFDALISQVDSINQVDLNQQRDTKINPVFAQNIMDELKRKNLHSRFGCLSKFLRKF